MSLIRHRDFLRKDDVVVLVLLWVLQGWIVLAMQQLLLVVGLDGRGLGRDGILHTLTLLCRWI